MLSKNVPPLHVSIREAIIYVVYNSGATDEEYEAYLNQMTRTVFDAARDHQVFAQVHDTSRWTRSTAKQRQMQADWIELHKKFLGSRCAGVSFVVTSALVRGGLTAVLWLSDFPMPYKVFGELGDADFWARARVDVAKRQFGLG